MILYCRQGAVSLNTPSLVDRLSAHRTLAALPRHEIEWVAGHGTVLHLDSGAVLTPKQGSVEGLHIVLRGYLSIHLDHGAGKRKIMEWRAGDVTGLMPYSRLVAPPGDVVAEEPSEVVTVYRADMPEMIRECHELTAILVHVMLDRARHFTSSYLHEEKLVSLGKLAAGLAHELNNPSSAIGRNAGELSAAFVRFDEASRSLGAAGLQETHLAVLYKVRDACFASGVQSVLSPLEQEDREESIAKWLRTHGLDEGTAEVLADTDITFDMMNELARSMPAPALNTSLRWIAVNSQTRRLTLEIQQSASRICELVSAVKGFTQMDRASVPEPVDLERGLRNTLAVLNSKAKGKSVGVRMSLDQDLPAVHGFGGELNQVWSNLIDNALDAVDEGGQVEITAKRNRDRVVVGIIDNGTGIPTEIRDRIFDPFFTTKPVGQGTGLGLDIVRRLIQRHNGEIELESRPGRTEFRVVLPISISNEGTPR
jgi:signal transduction histidine kinase